MPIPRIRPALGVAAASVAVLALGACSSSGSSTPAASTTTKPASARPLQVLVTNDDGYDAPGISVVTQALGALANVRVTVVAPATNQSGTGGKSTAGAVATLPGSKQTQAGHPATAVVGYPVDAVNYALGPMHLHPDLVVSGINQGQNLGAVTTISGTVGAAKRAATRGIPAIAVSQGLAASPQYDVAAGLTIDWVRSHRTGLVAHTATVDVVNLNVPTCTTGALRGVRQVPLAGAAEGAVAAANCASTVTTVSTDAEAFLNGFAAVTQLTPDGATVTTSTTFPATKGST
jgi:5'-nucleotidase